MPCTRRILLQVVPCVEHVSMCKVYSPTTLAFLLENLASDTLKLEARELAGCLYGLQKLTSTDPYVLQLVDALATKVTENSKEIKLGLNPQAVSNMLYGLQGLSSDHVEVRRLLAALAGAFEEQELTAQGVGNGLYGLQGMSNEVTEVRDLLVVLKPMVESAKRLDGQAIGNAFYGLQSMKSNSPEVRGMLEVLAEKVRRFNGKFTEQEASNALYGLQFMDDSEAPCVKDILQVLSSQTASGGEASIGQRRLNSRHPLNPFDQKMAQPRSLPADWLQSAFPSQNSSESHRYLLDLGCDMGGFARAMAGARSDLRVIGLELRPHAVAFANARAREEGLKNVAFLQVRLEETFFDSFHKNSIPCCVWVAKLRKARAMPTWTWSKSFKTSVARLASTAKEWVEWDQRKVNGTQSKQNSIDIIGAFHVFFVQPNNGGLHFPVLSTKVDTVTINFPDPHLTKEHRQRRLVTGQFVSVLAKYLRAGKEVLWDDICDGIRGVIFLDISFRWLMVSKQASCFFSTATVKVLFQSDVRLLKIEVGADWADALSLTLHRCLRLHFVVFPCFSSLGRRRRPSHVVDVLRWKPGKIARTDIAWDRNLKLRGMLDANDTSSF